MSESRLSGYSVRFPAGWSVRQEQEISPTHLHTEAALDDESLSVFVDHFTSPNFKPLSNRAALKAKYATDPKKYPGYSQFGRDRRRVSGHVTAYAFSFSYTSKAGTEVRRAKVMLSKRAGHGFVITANGFALWPDLEALADRVADSIELIDDPPLGNGGEPKGPGDLPVPEIGDYEGSAEEPGSGSGQQQIAMTFDEPGSADVTYEHDGVACRSTLSLNEDDVVEGVPGWLETMEEGGCPAGVWRIDVDDDGKITADWEPAEDDQTSTDGPSTIHAMLDQA